jgi:hypothetical protein
MDGENRPSIARSLLGDDKSSPVSTPDGFKARMPDVDDEKKEFRLKA